MCTAVISFDIDAPIPLLLLDVRDEFADRPWQPPGEHWPGLHVTGGLDLQGGGTWLAVHPDAPRAACVLNGRGRLAPAPGRRSRGELPVRAASDGIGAVRVLLDDPVVRTSYDPFHLVCAHPGSVTLLSWDSAILASRDMEPGTHMVMNDGLLYSSSGRHPLAIPAKAAYFGPRFAASRPSGDPDTTIKQAWGAWLGLAASADLPVGDPRALIVGRELDDGRLWGTTSMSLVALARDSVRYDFQRVCPTSTQPILSSWNTVLTAHQQESSAVR